MARKGKFSPDLISAIDSREEITEEVIEKTASSEEVNQEEVSTGVPAIESEEEVEEEAKPEEAEEIMNIPEETKEEKVKPAKTQRKSTKAAKKDKKAAKGKQICFTVDADLLHGLTKDLKYGDSLSAEINRQIRAYQVQNNILKE